MAVPEQLLCTHCLLPVVGYWSVNPLGLRRWRCPRCGATNEWPMSIARETVYWILAGGFLVWTIILFAQGIFVFVPAIIVVLMVVALALNHGAKRRLSAARERFQAQRSSPPEGMP